MGKEGPEDEWIWLNEWSKEGHSRLGNDMSKGVKVGPFLLYLYYHGAHPNSHKAGVNH